MATDLSNGKRGFSIRCMMSICIGMLTTSFSTAFASKAQTKNKVLFLLVLAALTSMAMADVTPSHMFIDHMVIQRDTAAPVWGKADVGEQVGPDCPCLRNRGCGRQVASGPADAASRWSVYLDHRR
jgi:hypothetical protein